MNVEFLLLLLLYPYSFTSGHNQEDRATASCPTWYHMTSDGKCECGEDLKSEVLCSTNKRVELMNEFCMGYDNASKVTVLGHCPYSEKNTFFYELPQDVEDLNNFTCSWLNRRGLLCSHCDESLGVAVLTYSYKCTKCLGMLRGWLLYFTLTLIPLTVFFLVIIFCNIRATAAHMNAMLCITHIMLSEMNAKPSLIIKYSYVKFLATILGFWNLDFFRYVYPPFCISEHYSTLKVLSFEYIPAIYILIVIVSLYTSIELYDRNYRLLRVLWKPFSLCSFFMRRYSFLNLKINVKSNLINAFATFIILAYSKILSTNYGFFSSAPLFLDNGSQFHPNEIPTLYNATKPYLGAEHKPYYIVAMIVLILFNIFPIILLLCYPTKTFQKLLGCFPRVRWDYLHIFMDCFQGCYKNGTNDTLDYRYVAGLYFIIRLIYPMTDTNGNVMLLLSATLLFGILRPYRNDLYNRLDCALFGIYTAVIICAMCSFYIRIIGSMIFFNFLFLPALYTLMLLLYSLAFMLCPRHTSHLVKVFSRTLWFKN